MHTIRTHHATRGVTILEVLIAIFVMLIGLTGVTALFPVGIRLSQEGTDDIISAMTAQKALAAVRLQAGLRARCQAYSTTPPNTAGDVLCWNGTASLGVDSVTGTVSAVGNPGATGDTLGYTKISVALTGVNARTLAVKTPPANNCALLLISSGNAMWKLYRLDSNSAFSTSKFAAETSSNNITRFPGDIGIGRTGDTFRLIGARDDTGVWATVPEGFYSVSGVYTLGQGAAPGYGYLAILTRLYGYTDTFRIDILVYKGYDKALPPEGNSPAVACYTTILAGSMLTQ